MKSIVYLFGGMLIAFSVYVFLNIWSSDIKKYEPVTTQTMMVEKNQSTIKTNVLFEAGSFDISRPQIEKSTKINNNELNTSLPPLLDAKDINNTRQDINTTYRENYGISQSIKKHRNLTILAYISESDFNPTFSHARENNGTVTAFTTTNDKIPLCETKDNTNISKNPIKQIYATYKEKIIFEIFIKSQYIDGNGKIKFKFKGTKGERIDFLYIRKDGSMFRNTAIIK